MNLAELFKKISYSGSAELAITGEGSGQIPEEHAPKVIQRINEALITLYTRFPLRMKTLTLQTYADINEYKLSSDYAPNSEADPLPETRYITSIFHDDLLMVDSIVDITDPVEDEELVYLNDANVDESWHIVAQNPDVIFSVNEPEDAQTFRVRYRAKPAEIPFGPWDEIKNTTIALPRVLEAALLHYINGNIYGNMSIEAGMAKSQNYLDMAENECKIVEERNTLNSSPAFTNTKPKKNGWP